jgi:hypothetical protein
MVNSNFDDLGVVEKLRKRAITFIMGVRGHVIEKVVEELGFSQKSGFLEGTKIQRNGSSQKVCSDADLWPALKIIYNTHTLFYAWSQAESQIQVYLCD